MISTNSQHSEIYKRLILQRTLESSSRQHVIMFVFSDLTQSYYANAAIAYVCPIDIQTSLA